MRRRLPPLHRATTEAPERVRHARRRRAWSAALPPPRRLPPPPRLLLPLLLLFLPCRDCALAAAADEPSADPAAPCRGLLARMDAGRPGGRAAAAASLTEWERLGCDQRMLHDDGEATVLVPPVLSAAPAADDAQPCRSLLQRMDAHAAFSPAAAARLAAEFESADCASRMMAADRGDARVLRDDPGAPAAAAAAPWPR